ncbi:MFS transporter [Nitratireductor sp. XY-223]|uniref:MFS transporter n=1 Tax=Nitratireductor sp. XY-223 TaxID=2561926 RepID=UPI0010AB4111|nr:MFS transporter [Nitratireductor sp. XY-223]
MKMYSARPISLILLLVTLAVPVLLFSFLSVRIVEPKLISEFEAQTRNAAVSLHRQIGRAVSAFGGIDALREVEPVLDRVRSFVPGFSLLALTDQNGTILHMSAGDNAAVRGALLSPSPAPDWCVTGGSTKIDQSAKDLLVTKFPLCNGNRLEGFLHAGINVEKLGALKRDLWIDTAVVTIALILLIVEILILIFAAYIIRPIWAIDFLTARLRDRDLRFILQGSRRGIIRQINGIMTHASASLKSATDRRLPGPGGPRALHMPAVSYIRLPLFLFFLSEALMRPILPRFLGENFGLPDGDQHLLIGILMSGFMVASLLSVLIGSIYSERRRGPRWIFLCGAIIAGCGMYGHIIAGDFASVFLFRVMTGFGYGLVYAAAQVYIAQHTDSGQRTAGFSIFLAVIVAAEICGPAVGGLVTDRFGEERVVQAATFVIALAALLCVLLLPRFPPDITDPNSVPNEKDGLAVDGARNQLMDGWRSHWNMFLEVLSNTRFVVVLVCFAIPAKALLTGGLFLLIPLTVFSTGGAAIESARVLMAYGIAILLLLPVLAPLADRWRGFGIWVATGGMAAGLGFVLPNVWNVFGSEGLTVLLFGTILFGFGQTLSIPTQVSFILRVADPQVAQFGMGPVLGLYRFVERLGSLAGPLVAGMLLIIYPPAAALMWMGLGAIALAAIGLSWFLAFGNRNENEAIDALLVET